MLRSRDDAWFWDDQPLDLQDPEPALLTAMLREPDQTRQPHVWLALSLHQPYDPASGIAFLTTLQDKLRWAGAPYDFISRDPTLGCAISAGAEISRDPETQTAAGIEPLDERGASGA
ncbi:MAG TPA: hypothetical protein QGF05_15150 [Dehalococcoidia bacterium]|nr:hypothetical protein [Dehalococcoidia bacterium]